MATIPPGFKPVENPRTVQFEFAPGTPQSVIDATKAYAAHDAQQQAPQQQGADVEIPEGFQLLGPGIGKPSPEANPGREREDMRQLAAAGKPPNPLENFLTGGRYGIEGTLLGGLQLATRMPRSNMDAYMFADTPPDLDTTAAADEMARDFASRREHEPAMHTAAGSVGEFGGSMVATAPLMGASVPAKGAPLLSWLGRGALGGGLVAGTQPVTQGEFGSGKVEQVATGAGLSALVPAALRGGMSLAERAYAPNALAQAANLANRSANAKPFAREGEELAQRTGVRLTPGQVSGSKVQTALENMSRQSIFSADRAFEADTRIANDAVRYIDRLMDNITRNPASEATIGTQLQAITRGAVVKIATKREQVAALEYGALDKALGGRKFVQPDNAVAEADAIIREYSAVASPEAQRIVRQAEALRAQLQRNGGLTFTEAQRSRGYYGRGARGAANVFDDVNPDINRRIATRIFKAFDADIEQSATRLETLQLGPGIVPEGYFRGQVGGNTPRGLADAIKAANANYRRYSQLIDATESHPISRLFGDNVKIDDVLEFDKIAPETVIQRLGAMKPTELQMVRGFMENNAPEAWQQYKRLLVEKAVDSARTLPTSMGANTVPFNATMFVRALGGDKPDRIRQLNAIFGASELRELDDAFRVARRLGDNFGRNHSGTGPYMEAMRFFDSVKSFSARALASSGGEALGLRKVANVMLNAEGRRALIALSKLPPGSRQAASLLGVVSALSAGQESKPSYNPNRAYRPEHQRP